jgi:hypothetical protein
LLKFSESLKDKWCVIVIFKLTKFSKLRKFLRDIVITCVEILIR